MKHTKNTNSVKLKIGKEYKVIESRDKQLLIYIDGEKIAQRWVDRAVLEIRRRKIKNLKTNLN